MAKADLIHFDELHEVAVFPDVAGQLAVEAILLHLPLRPLVRVHDPAVRMLEQV